MRPVDGNYKQQTLRLGDAAKPLDGALPEGGPGDQLLRVGMRNAADIERHQSPRVGISPKLTWQDSCQN